MYLQMFARVDKYLPHFIIHYQRTILIIKWNNLRMKAASYGKTGQLLRVSGAAIPF